MKRQLNKTEQLIITITIYLSFIGGMVSQLNHTITVYQRLDPLAPIIYSICFAVSFDLFAGIAIMVGWKRIALISSIAMTGINLLCYRIFENTVPGISAILISLIQPGMIYAYSILIHNRHSEEIIERKKPGPKPKEI